MNFLFLHSRKYDEVVVASYGENVYEYGGISVYVNDGAGVIGAGKHTKLAKGTREVAIAELTGDAHNDVLYAAFGYGFTILPGNGTGNMGPAVSVPTTSAPSYIDVADIDRDGHTLDHRLVVAGKDEEPRGDDSRNCGHEPGGETKLRQHRG